MSRISKTFEVLRDHGHKALIPYIMAGDPKPDLTVELMHGLVEAGGDIIELGVPFSDPTADGPVIQHAAERALQQGVTLRTVLDMVRLFRQLNHVTPVVLMGYLNPVHDIGYRIFAQQAYEAGVDGILIVDCPPEESSELSAMLKEKDVDLIYLLSPTTAPERVKFIADQARGYLYYVSLKGVTGATNLDINQVSKKIAFIRELTSLPIGIGFGIRDAETASQMAHIADAVVVGSRLVDEMQQLTLTSAKERLMKVVAELKAGVIG